MATSYTVTGPTVARAGTTSTSFTIASNLGDPFSGTDVITVTSSDPGDRITPTPGTAGTGSVAITPDGFSETATFTVRRTGAGVSSLSFTNNAALPNPNPARIAFPAGRVWRSARNQRTRRG